MFYRNWKLFRTDFYLDSFSAESKLRVLMKPGMTIWLQRKINWMINCRLKLKPSLTIYSHFIMVNCYSWRAGKINVSNYVEKHETLIRKRLLILLPKIIPISFLKKWHCLSTMSCTGNVQVKVCEKYWNVYLVKRSRYYPNKKIRKILLQILIIFYFKSWEYYCINSGSWMSRDSTLDN